MLFLGGTAYFIKSWNDFYTAAFEYLGMSYHARTPIIDAPSDPYPMVVIFGDISGDNELLYDLIPREKLIELTSLV